MLFSSEVGEVFRFETTTVSTKKKKANGDVVMHRQWRGAQYPSLNIRSRDPTKATMANPVCRRRIL